MSGALEACHFAPSGGAARAGSGACCRGQEMEHLAAMKIPIVRLDLGEAAAQAAADVVRSGWIGQGPQVEALETEWATAVGAAHAVAVSNCTVALELALRLIGVSAGDDVLTVSHSFIATANAVVAVGACPIFVDVEVSSYGMDPKKLAGALTNKCKAILCVHQFGLPCDLQAILAFANQHGLPVVEDAACAIGSEIEIAQRFERVGKPHGIIAGFSLHPRKVITCGDGGILTTSDAALANRARLLRQHAMSIGAQARHHASEVVFENFVEPAYNYRMTDLQAAVARAQLAKLDVILVERRRLAARYTEALANHPQFRVPSETYGRSNWQSYPVRLRDEATTTQREWLELFLASGIAARRGIANAHQQPAYARRDTGGQDLSVSEMLGDRTILLPLFHGLTDAEQDLVIATCKQV